MEPIKHQVTQTDMSMLAELLCIIKSPKVHYCQDSEKMDEEAEQIRQECVNTAINIIGKYLH